MTWATIAIVVIQNGSHMNAGMFADVGAGIAAGILGEQAESIIGMASSLY